jgi:hypothetical protein
LYKQLTIKVLIILTDLGMIILIVLPLAESIPEALRLYSSLFCAAIAARNYHN